MARSSVAACAGWLGLSTCCHGLYDPIRRIESARVYGNIDEYAYYYIDLVVGTPGQRVSVIIDTGSSIAAFPCAGCGHCGKHIDPAFDIGQSSSAKWMGCSRSCQRCKEKRCSYQQSYSEGSEVSGYWFEDEVQLGDSIQRNPPVRSRLGCHFLENNLFFDQKANGIMGIGPPQHSTLLGDLFSDSAHVSSKIFSLCLAEWGGRFVVGGHNDSYHTGPLQYMPMTTAWGYYGVPITAMRVDGKVVSTEMGKALVDSGTTYTYMGHKPYHALRGAIERLCAEKRCGEATLMDNRVCWHVPRGNLGQFPRVELLFGDVTVLWVPGGYLYSKGRPTTWCYSFQNDWPRVDTTLGASWMMHNEIVFDLQRGRLGVAPAICPEYRERPQHTPTKPGWGVEVVVQGYRLTPWQGLLGLILVATPVALAVRCWPQGSRDGVREVPSTVLGKAAE